MIIRNEGESLTQRTVKIRTDLIYGTKGLKSRHIKWYFEEISANLSSFPLAAASAAEPAQADVALRYEAATLSVTVTSKSLFPWCECETIRAFTVSL